MNFQFVKKSANIIFSNLAMMRKGENHLNLAKVFFLPEIYENKLLEHIYIFIEQTSPYFSIEKK